MEEMWVGFTDQELIELAILYGIQGCIVVDEQENILNRERVEWLLTEAELNVVFPVDFNYNFV